MAYHLHARAGRDFDAAVEAVRTALAAEGFGVLSDIDVAGTLEKKLGVRRPAYRILGACNPGFANQALQLEPDLGVLLPCNVIVRQDDDGGVTVAAVDPAASLSLTGNAELAPIAAQVRERLERALRTVGQAGG